jgi:hypothetical protein
MAIKPCPWNPDLEMMEVRVDGKIELRKFVVHVSTHEDRRYGAYGRFKTREPEHTPNEQVMWFVGDDVPTIIKIGKQ